MKKDKGTIFVATYLPREDHAVLKTAAKSDLRSLQQYLRMHLTKLAERLRKNGREAKHLMS